MVLKVTEDGKVLVVAGRPLHCPPPDPHLNPLLSEDQSGPKLANQVHATAKQKNLRKWKIKKKRKKKEKKSKKGKKNGTAKLQKSHPLKNFKLKGTLQILFNSSSINYGLIIKGFGIVY